MRRQLVGGVFALLLTLSPSVAMAQGTTFDADTRATVERMAKEVAGRVMPGHSLAEAQPDSEPPAAPMPEPSGEPESEPEGEAENGDVVIPEVDLTDLVEYTNQGVTIQAPATWSVEPGDGEAIFYINIPDTGNFIALGSTTSEDIPSLVAMAFFRSQTDLVLQDFGNGEAVESTTLYTSQGLPLTKLAFTGESLGEDQAGVIYITAPNESVYSLIASGPPEEWEKVAEAVQSIANSIVFDEELISLSSIGDEPETFTEGDGKLEVEVPAGWYALDVEGPVFQVVLSEPEVRFAVAVAAGEDFNDALEPSMLAQIVPSDGELTAEEQEALIADIMDILMNSGGDVELEEEAASVLTREGAVTVIAPGTANLQSGVIMPVKFYVDLRPTGGAVVAVFGDLDTAATVEAEIQMLVESVTGL